MNVLFTKRCNLYEVIAEPPLSTGARQETASDPSEAQVAVGAAGAPGALVWLVYETGVALRLVPPELMAATV